MIQRKELLAPAKINLFFEANYLYPNGYHNITSIMQTVSLYDHIKIELLSNTGNITVSTSNIPHLSGSDNIAHLAAKLFLENAKIESVGVDISIKKTIPLLSGLGGGSADAAAVLLGLNQMFDQPLTTNELVNIGQKIGADVPFCIIQGTSLVGGIGEVTRPCPKLPHCNIVIVKHGEKISTKDMYEKIDKVDGRTIHSEANMLSAMKRGDLKEISSCLYNAFTPFYAQNDMIARYFTEFGALGHCLSGSGPSRFAIFDNFSNAQEATAFFNKKNIEAYLVSPVDAKPLF